MATKMPGRLVALSASAVATIYLAGLLSTQPGTDTASAAAQGAATATSSPTPASSTQPSANPTTGPTVVVGASATSTPAATATSAPATAASPTTTTATSTYANGTYSATGTSQLGNVTVSVTVSGDKISNVQITRVTTKFPVSRIASLPAQVIQNQSSSVNVVSGATYSSQAFKQAVQTALAQARVANSTTAAG